MTESVPIVGDVTISNNYTEANTGTVIYARSRNLLSSVTIKNNYFNENIKVEMYLLILYGDISRFTDDSIMSTCIIEDWQNFKIKWIPEDIIGQSVVLMNFNKGITNIDDNIKITACKEGLVGTTLSSSWIWCTPKTYTNMAEVPRTSYASFPRQLS